MRARRRRPRRLSCLGLAAVLCVVMVVSSLWLWHGWTRGGVQPSMPDTVRVRIHPGMSLRAAADTLARRGLLTNERLFLLGARLEGRDRDLKPGVFAVPVGASPRDLLRALVDVSPLPVIVTIPEGLEAAEVADLVAGALGCQPREFLAVADAYVARAAESFPLFTDPWRRATYARLVTGTVRAGARRLHWCEGFLAPDTYHFYEGTTAQVAARTMVDLQLARLDSALALSAKRPGRSRLSPHELVTLASIVEAEAKLARERPRVAAVYANRLRDGMRLEADPTVAYWLNKRGQRLFFADLRVGSPFNTYLNAGLPPGPIGTPGWSALVSAALPDTACDALFFVADGHGGHVFSRSLDDHNRAVQRYRDLRQRDAVDARGATR